MSLSDVIIKDKRSLPSNSISVHGQMIPNNVHYYKMEVRNRSVSEHINELSKLPRGVYGHNVTHLESYKRQSSFYPLCNQI